MEIEVAKQYDVIVVGSGIGGLTAAGLLAKSGKSVLLLERHDRAGGYAHGFKRRRYFFDSGVHLTSGCGPQGYRGGQVIHKVIHALSVQDRIEFIRINPFSHAYYPDFNIDLPHSVEAFVATLAKQYPEEEQGLRDLISLCLQLSEELAVADEIMANGNHEKAHELLPALFKYRRSTLADVYKKFIGNKKLQGVFATLWPYLGLPPSKVSFLYWSTMFIGYLVDGAYYCKGGFQVFSDTLAKGVTKNGGEIRFKAHVEKIVVEDGQIKGVKLKSGQRFEAPVVIANTDMRQTVHQLIGEQHFPARFLKRMQTMSHSLSIFAVYIATDLDLNSLKIGHESFCYQDFNHDENFNKTKVGNVSWISITVPSLADSSLAPDGQHIIMLTTLAPYDIGEPWGKAKSLYMDKMLRMAGEYIPGLENHLLFIDGGSPTTMERYTLNHQGSAYGWDVTPDQVGPNRIQNRSPINGLYFAGHWSAPGGGVYGVCVSGLQTAQQVLGITRQDDFWKFLCKNEKNKNLSDDIGN